MRKNEWGVKPGTQVNITTEDAPMLSDMECDLVNLFRSFPENQQKVIMKMIFQTLMEGKGNGKRKEDKIQG